MRRVFGYAAVGVVAAFTWPVLLANVLLTPAFPALALAVGVQSFGVRTYAISSSAMEPTLHCARPAPGCDAGVSDRVLANRFIYHFRDPRRGDVVVFKAPDSAERKCGAGGTFVKRIIGLPGETLEIRSREGASFVHVDGSPLDEPYIEMDRPDSGLEETFSVPGGQYFVMGDNRAQSCDSRVFGPVPEESLIGKVSFTYWPLQRISDNYSRPADTR